MECLLAQWRVAGCNEHTPGWDMRGSRGEMTFINLQPHYSHWRLNSRPSYHKTTSVILSKSQLCPLKMNGRRRNSPCSSLIPWVYQHNHSTRNALLLRIINVFKKPFALFLSSVPLHHCRNNLSTTWNLLFHPMLKNWNAHHTAPQAKAVPDQPCLRLQPHPCPPTLYSSTIIT